MFAVEGNIGAGKSTLVRQLALRYPDRSIILAEEPVSAWDNVKNTEGESILTLFYRDQRAYAFSFQILACFTRFKSLIQIHEENPEAIIVCERSLLTDFHVFAKMMLDLGNIKKEEFSIYTMMYEYFVSKLPIQGLIYLKTSPIVALERCVRRNRAGERVSLDYLEMCHDYHEAWIMSSSLPTLVLDANQTYTPELESKWIDVIQAFME